MRSVTTLRCQSFARRRLSTEAAANAHSAFLGIFGSKEEQIALKNSDVDTEGVWHSLPASVRASLDDPRSARFERWLGLGVPDGKAAIIRLLAEAEANAIIACMRTEAGQPGVLGAARVTELYAGRAETARHLVSDKALAERLFGRIRAASVCGRSFLDSMDFGPQVVGVGEKLRLVTTFSGGGHGKHADISERSDDGTRISRLTFQCYLNPERYEGGHFQWYPPEGGEPVDVPVGTGCAVVFVQEDPQLLHGGGRKLGGDPKRAIRGNLDVMAPDTQGERT